MKAEPDQRPRSASRAQSELVVRNLQRSHAVDRRSLTAFLGEVAVAVGAEDQSLTLALVSDEKIRVLNRDFRGFDKPTDVLSFGVGAGWRVTSAEAGAYLGDIVISVETAHRQARRRRTTLGRELRLLALHGFLHLLGYDHQRDDGEMRRVEYRLRKKFHISSARRVRHVVAISTPRGRP